LVSIAQRRSFVKEIIGKYASHLLQLSVAAGIAFASVRRFSSGKKNHYQRA
jgi:hypothetical protein